MLFAIKIFLTTASYQFFQNGQILIDHGSFFQQKILYNLTVSNFENELITYYTKDSPFKILNNSDIDTRKNTDILSISKSEYNLS